MTVILIGILIALSSCAISLHSIAHHMRQVALRTFRESLRR